MNPKVSYALVGLFVMILGAALVTTTIWLSATAGERHTTRYVAYMYESVSGLNVTASVTYRGVRVGKVDAIAIDRDHPDRVRLLLSIEAGTPVKEDTVAILQVAGLTGIAHVELTGGSRESPMLRAQPGQRYPEIRTGPSLLVRLDTAITNLVTRMQDVTTQLAGVAARVDTLLSDENQRNIANTLSNIETITGSIASRSRRLESSIDHLNIIMTNVARASEGLPGLIDQTGDSVSSVSDVADAIGEEIDGLDEAIAAIREAADSIGEVAGEAQNGISAFTRTTPTQVSELLAEIQMLSESLRQVVEELGRTPNSLVFGRPAPPEGPGE